jgi:hypothetical protein
MTKTVRDKPLETRWLLLGSILAAAALLRVWGLWDYAYNVHELQFLIIAEARTLAEIWQRSLAETHPPLLHYLRHFLLLLTPDVFAQRLYSAAAGTGAVYAMYRLGRQLRNEEIGLFAALCMAFAMIAVSISMVVRAYAFFLLLLLPAMLFFRRYQETRAQGDLARFAALLLVASAFNFSGFLAAAACGLLEGFRLLRARDWRQLFVYCLSFVPLALLALVLYFNFMGPGTTGPMWNKVYVANGLAADTLRGRFTTTVTQMALLFVPWGGTNALPSTPVFSKIVLLLMTEGMAVLAAAQAYGLWRLWRLDRLLFAFIAVLWGVTFVASVTGLYPFSTARHITYLLPFFILPFAYAAEPVTARVLKSPALSRLAAACILLFALPLAFSRIYMGFANELTLTRGDLAAGQQFLAERLKPGDAIVTGKVSAYFSLLDAADHGEHPYDGYGDFAYANGSRVLAPFDPPFKPHWTLQDFRDNLTARVQDGTVPRDGKFWFVMYGWRSVELTDLLQCAAAAPDIADFLSRPAVLIYSIRETDLRRLLKNETVWKQCFAGYAPSDIGRTFPVLPDPRPGSGHAGGQPAKK